MKKNKWILIVSAIVCCVLAITVIAIASNKPEHKHALGESITYHVGVDSVYYTRQCTDGYTERFETEIGFQDVLLIATENDNIVLEEDLELTQIVRVNSFIVVDGQPQGRDIYINLDLNGHTISSNINQSTNTESIKSMFILNAPYGKIDFKAQNGKLISEDLSYIINFSNNSTSGENLHVDLNNVECKVTGENAAPLFVNNTNHNSKFKATDCQFIASKSTTSSTNTGVGAFINANSEFTFTNCEFEGGDGMYVKAGKVTLDGCKLISKQRVWQSGAETVSSKFSPLGSALTAESYHQNSGYSKFEITLTNCQLQSINSSKMIYTAQTADAGLEKGHNASSSINVSNCTFNKKPSTDVLIINYSSAPILNDNLWVVE